MGCVGPYTLAVLRPGTFTSMLHDSKRSGISQRSRPIEDYKHSLLGLVTTHWVPQVGALPPSP